VPKIKSPHEFNFSKNFNFIYRIFFEYFKEELLQIPEKLITYAAHMHICPSFSSSFTLSAKIEMIIAV